MTLVFRAAIIRTCQATHFTQCYADLTCCRRKSSSRSDASISELLDSKALIPEIPPIHMCDYSYTLREECIAKYPAYPRGASRLLRVEKDGTVTHHANFSQSFLQLVGPDSHLVFNESKVVPARLKVSEGSTTSLIEMLLLTVGNERNNGLEQPCHNMKLKVMIRKENVQPGEFFMDPILGTKFLVSSADAPWEEDEDSDGNGTECTVQCVLANVKGNKTLQQLLNDIGSVPIPPYLHREAVPSDAEAYNNVYANDKKSGSVAAPTAGLHFTRSLLERIGQENISYLSLNVGGGTFKPVLVQDACDHYMHSEQFSVSVAELRRIIKALESGKRLIAVGTTTCRTLESLYWCGVRHLLQGDTTDLRLSLGQVEWNHLEHMVKEPISALESFSSIVQSLPDEHVLHGHTRLMIMPQVYQFKVVQNLVTNFHAPDSTLLLLISAFLGGGDKVRSIYHVAQQLGYRFLSYGDVCLFSR